jgi:hypothetical protein
MIGWNDRSGAFSRAVRFARIRLTTSRPTSGPTEFGESSVPVTFRSGRGAIVLADNARIHTPQGAKVIREAVDRHGDRLRLVPTPAYDPPASPAELLFRPFRRAVTHTQHRADFWDLYADAEQYFTGLDAKPERAVRHIGSPFAAPVDQVPMRPPGG